MHVLEIHFLLIGQDFQNYLVWKVRVNFMFNKSISLKSSLEQYFFQVL